MGGAGGGGGQGALSLKRPNYYGGWILKLHVPQTSGLRPIKRVFYRMGHIVENLN